METINSIRNVSIFKQESLFGIAFNIYGSVDNPLFLAKDVAEWISYSKSGNGSYNITQMLAAIDEDEKIFSATKVDNLLTH